VRGWKKFRRTGSKQVVFARRLDDGRWKIKFTRLGLIRRVVDAETFARTYESVDVVSAVSRALRET
jgi:hypothetical protein